MARDMDLLEYAEVQRFSDYLRVLYQGATHHAMDTFINWALEGMRGLLDFDSAMLAHGADIILPHNVQLYRQPVDMLESYREVAFLEPARDYLLKHALGQTFKYDDVISKEDFDQHPLYRNHAKFFGLEYTLVSSRRNPHTCLVTILALYRSDRNRPFSNAERRLNQLLFPHVIEAYERNVLHHLQRRLGVEGGSDQAHALCDTEGYLHVADESFLAKLNVGWPNWRGPRLPDFFVNQLQKQSTSWPKEAFPFFDQVGKVADLYHLSYRQGNVLDQLSQQQRRVAEMLAEGLSYKEIAQRLQISLSTVKGYVEILYQRLGVKNKTELATRVTRFRGTFSD